jgi:GxxExxY protein
MHADRMNKLSRVVIGRAFVVLNTLRIGFQEKVYENPLGHELRKAGLDVEQQSGMVVMYDGIVAGRYVVDLIMKNCLLVELKTVKAFEESHTAQCINYLKATRLKLCLLPNFARPGLEIKHVVNRL